LLPLAGLDIRNANNGAPPHYRVLYLELRQRPVSREHRTRAASAPGPRPPAASRRRPAVLRTTEEGQGQRREQRGASPGAGRGHHRPPNPAAQGPSWTPDPGPPGPHPAQPSSSLDPGGERGPTIRPLAPLIAQLVSGQLLAPGFVFCVPMCFS
jgi:hypothetical protein